MLTHPERTSTRLIGFLAALVLVAWAGIAIDKLGGDETAATAMLEIGGTAYGFAPSTCTVTETDFLAAGSGRINGEDYWISVSPSGAELALGTSNEMERSDDGDDLWLHSVGEIAWTATDGSTVEGRLTMVDLRVTQAPQVRGTFTLSCESA